MYFIHISGFDELLCLLICCRTRKICTRRTLSSFESFPIPKKISTRWRLLLAGCAQKALKSKPEHITCLCFWSMEEVKACWLMEGKRPFCRRELPVSSDTGSRCHTSTVEQSFSSSWWGTRSSVNGRNIQASSPIKLWISLKRCQMFRTSLLALGAQIGRKDTTALAQYLKFHSEKFSCLYSSSVFLCTT